jgi:hypothetical protein
VVQEEAGRGRGEARRQMLGLAVMLGRRSWWRASRRACGGGGREGREQGVTRGCATAALAAGGARARVDEAR